MSARQWKPGDVAMLTDRFDTTERVGIFYPSGDDVGGQAPFGKWFLPGTNERVWSSVKSVRPLAVIDPEDREQVKGLVQAWFGQADPFDEDFTPRMQAALRSLTADPKPEEPTGLGAVVEDAEGRKYVHAPDGPGDSSPWACGADDGGFFEWNDITAIKVLSEGVTP